MVISKDSGSVLATEGSLSIYFSMLVSIYYLFIIVSPLAIKEYFSK
jgi:hypothetical protein